MKNLDKIYWSRRYEEDNTPWDIGQASQPLIAYLKTIQEKDLRILIPGAGYAHEAAFLFEHGFKNVFVCDWAEQALEVFHKRNPEFSKENLICENYFDLDLKVDLIIEQTFFCALPRNLRMKYVEKSAQLLQKTSKTYGKLVGLLLAQEFKMDGPPFGGTPEEYNKLFSPHFKIEKMEISQNSIAPRAGRELFVTFKKK